MLVEYVQSHDIIYGMILLCYSGVVLYTRKGDSGTTKVLNSQARFSKSAPRAEALGALDELNSFLGLCKAKSREVDVGLGGGKKLSECIEDAQQNLFIVQAQVAGSALEIAEEKVKRIEQVVDAIEKEIPKITGFSIVGGTELSALLDVARAMSRRAERRVVAWNESGERTLGGHTLPYLNRLSSLLFALARLVNHRAGVKEKNPHYR